MKRSSVGGKKDSPPLTLDLFSGMIRRLAALLPKHVFRVVLAVVAAGLFAASAAQATITVTGDVEPTSPAPASWTSSTTAYVGNASNGSLTVDGGSALSSFSAYLGYNTGVTGTVNIDGVGSKWTNGTTVFYAGYNGTGVVNIAGGGALSTQTLYLGINRGSSGTINIDGVGSSLTSANPNIFIGALGNGLVTVTNGATFTSGTSSVGSYVSIGQSSAGGTVIVSGAGSTWKNTGKVYVGQGGLGTLSITSGGAVASTGDASIGLTGTSQSTATVGGASSAWTVGGNLYIGKAANGELSVVNGGVVSTGSSSSSNAYLGYGSGVTGRVTVDGAGSAWNHTGTIYVGYTGTGSRLGQLSISDGGAVTSTAVSINAISTLTTDVGSKLTVGSGTGTLTNSGTLRLVAGAGAASGTYTPISYGTLSGNDAQALGGVWNSTNHTVTVNPAATTTPGVSTTFDLSTTQRVLVDPSGPSVGASFQAAPSGTMLTFSATGISGAELSALQSKLAAGQSVLSGWSFSTTGYTSGKPVYLSLFAGAGQTLSGLTIWDYTGGAWGQFSAADLAYNGTYASFTTTNLNDFAVSGATPTPIPGALLLFGPGLVGLGLVKRRFFA